LSESILSDMFYRLLFISWKYLALRNNLAFSDTAQGQAWSYLAEHQLDGAALPLPVDKWKRQWRNKQGENFARNLHQW
jgi:hypothetical protein